MAAAVQNVLKQNKILLGFKKELQDNTKEYNELLQKSSVNVSMMQLYGNFFTWKRQQINLQQLAVRKAEEEKHKCLLALQEAQKKVESLEKLRQSRFEEYQYEFFAQEQKQIDEIGLQMHMRKN